jgi:hypothetical protein
MRYVSLVVRVGRHRLAPENDISSVSCNVSHGACHVKLDQGNQCSSVRSQLSRVICSVAMLPSTNKMHSANVVDESGMIESQGQHKCDICGKPCQVYKNCNYCHKGQVTHHGRCCLSNPNRVKVSGIGSKSHGGMDEGGGVGSFGSLLVVTDRLEIEVTDETYSTVPYRIRIKRNHTSNAVVKKIRSNMKESDLEHQFED